MIIVLLILLPLIASILLFTNTLGKHSKTFALVVSQITFIVSLVGGYAFTFASNKILVIDLDLKKYLDLNITMTMDALSLVLVTLTTLLVPIIIASSEKNENRTSTFYAFIMLMELSLIGVFTASDMILFYIFWELALIPIFFITAFWGSGDTKRISIKFLIYTIVGSFAMLIAILYLYTLTSIPHGFDFKTILSLNLPYHIQIPIFLAFFLAFAIKIPLFPFHSWQVETYNSSPVQGSMLLAGIMLKMGLYGIIRFILPLCKDVLFSEGSIIYILFITFGVLYGAMIAINQAHIKKLIAFASLSHVGIIALGIFSNTKLGLHGSILQMFSHGVNVVGLFACYNIIKKRTKTDIIKDLGGIASQAPVFAVVFLIIVLANISLPLTNSFVGEFLILLGVFQQNIWIAIIAGLSIILGAIYMLKMYQQVMYGTASEASMGFKDLTKEEIMIFVPIVLLIFVIGIYPSLILHLLDQVI
jgi:NADH-quinone oxidoreductase subunit M